MFRVLSTSLMTLGLISSVAIAQDGPLRRAGRALDNMGKNIRAGVENEVAREQITARERDVLNRVSKRIEWDKQLAGSTLSLEVRPGGAVALRGSVASQAAKLRAVDLVENTTGVTSVVDELAVVKDVKVIEAAPAPATTTTRVIEVTPPITVPSETKVIVRP